MIIYQKNALLQLSKQYSFLRMLGPDWNVDINAGLLTSEENSFPIQLLGIENQNHGLWIWPWDASSSGAPSSLLSMASQLEIKLNNGIAGASITADRLNLQKIPPKVIAIEALSIMDADVFFIVPMQPGVNLYIIIDSRGLASSSLCIEDISDSITELLAEDSTLIINGLAKLSKSGMPVTVARLPNQVSIVNHSGGKILLDIDKNQRITAINKTANK